MKQILLHVQKFREKSLNSSEFSIISYKKYMNVFFLFIQYNNVCIYILLLLRVSIVAL